MNTIATRDQFKQIRIGENLAVSYNAQQLDYLLSISMRDSWVGLALVNYHMTEISSS